MNDKINADRFNGFSQLYNNVRPTLPEKACDILINYIGKKPQTVVDLGCGTGLSAYVWQGKCEHIIGVDPSADMLKTATENKSGDISFIKAFSDNTTLPDESADIVVCSQSFHWMEPNSTLAEINRILKNGGVFATVDCDWPPYFNWQAEKAYNEFMEKVHRIEKEYDKTKNTFCRWNKNEHLDHIKSCGYFAYSREIVFSNEECGDAERFAGIAFSQGGFQTVMKKYPELIENDAAAFKNKISRILGNNKFTMNFCYRMRIGIKSA